MNFKVGDLVSRNSHNNDIVFRINKIIDSNVYLVGVNVRLCADADLNDIVKVDQIENDDNEIIERNMGFLNMDRPPGCRSAAASPRRARRAPPP